jgi:hypothetical protein
MNIPDALEIAAGIVDSGGVLLELAFVKCDAQCRRMVEQEGGIIG